MNLYKTIKRIRPKSLWPLLKLSVTNPLFIIPTVQATKDCMRTSTDHFGSKHYQNGPANAFRHALWNFLIAKKCTKWSKNQEKILKWTKNITEWHEEAFKNREMARLMDLHNNAIGRTAYCANSLNSIDEVEEILLEMTTQAVKINNEKESLQYKNHLVFLTS